MTEDSPGPSASVTTVDSTSKEENDGGEEGSCGLENLHAAVESTDGRWTEAKVVDLDAAARIARLTWKLKGVGAEKECTCDCTLTHVHEGKRSHDGAHTSFSGITQQGNHCVVVKVVSESGRTNKWEGEAGVRRRLPCAVGLGLGERAGLEDERRSGQGEGHVGSLATGHDEDGVAVSDAAEAVSGAKSPSAARALAPHTKARWRKVLKEEEEMAEAFGGRSGGRGSESASRRQEDEAGAAQTPSLVGIVECIFSYEGAPKSDGECAGPKWQVGHRVEALWRGRVVRQNEGEFNVQESVCDYYAGVIVACHVEQAWHSYDVRFDDGEMGWAIPPCHLRDRSGHVGLVVKRYFRPREIELRPKTCTSDAGKLEGDGGNVMDGVAEASQMLLLCAGEVVESAVVQAVSCWDLDCLDASIHFVSPPDVRFRDKWYKKSFDSWMHSVSFKSEIKFHLVGPHLHMVCASFYDHLTKTLAPMVVQGSARSLLAALREQKEEESSHMLNSNGPDKSEWGKVSIRSMVSAGAEEGSKVSVTAKSQKVGRKPSVGNRGQGDKGAVGGQDLPKYAHNLTHLMDYSEFAKWPRVEVVLHGPSVKNLTRDERVKRVHRLANEYMRVFAHAPPGEKAKGQKIAVKKAVEKELNLYKTIAARAETVDHWRGGISKLMASAKQQKDRSKAVEFSDDEEEIEVDDVESIARKSMLRALQKSQVTEETVDWSSDWTCRKCSVHVFARNRECFRCGSPRVEACSKPAVSSDKNSENAVTSDNILELGAKGDSTYFEDDEMSETQLHKANGTLDTACRSRKDKAINEGLEMSSGSDALMMSGAPDVRTAQTPQENDTQESLGNKHDEGTASPFPDCVPVPVLVSMTGEPTRDVARIESAPSIFNSPVKVIQSADASARLSKASGQGQDPSTLSGIKVIMAGETSTAGASDRANSAGTSSTTVVHQAAPHAGDTSCESITKEIAKGEGAKGKVDVIDEDAEVISKVSFKPLKIPRNKDPSADTLLKNLIEKTYLEFMIKGKGSEKNWKYFEFRGSKLASLPDARAYFDEDGKIVDSEVPPHSFAGLNSWARAIKKRDVSVKPVIFYQGMSLRQYEEAAAAAAALSTENWRGPSDPDGTREWVKVKLAGVRKGLPTSEDEVRRIVRQDLDRELQKYVEMHGEKSCRGQALRNLRATMHKSRLYQDEEHVEKTLDMIFRRSGLAFSEKDGGQTEQREMTREERKNLVMVEKSLSVSGKEKANTKKGKSQGETRSLAKAEDSRQRVDAGKPSGLNKGKKVVDGKHGKLESKSKSKSVEERKRTSGGDLGEDSSKPSKKMRLGTASQRQSRARDTESDGEVSDTAHVKYFWRDSGLEALKREVIWAFDQVI